MRSPRTRSHRPASLRLVAVTAGFALAAAALASGCRGAERAVPTLAVADTVASAARPFPLRNVRLLEGPFRDAMLRDQEYLLSLDPDRLLHNFRVNAGLASSAEPLGGWEAPDVELRGHTIGHYLTALSLMVLATGDERFRERADAVVDGLVEVQEALPAQGYNEGYLSAFPESFFGRVEARERVWAPYYTIHKIMAGLLDTYLLTGNQRGLDAAVAMAGWVRTRVDGVTHEQMQAALGTEFGGMNDVLANLYAVTGDPEHLRLARAFEHEAVLGPLARGEDPLDGLHGNTQIPKVIGAAREYELTGEPRYRDIATYFWDRVANHRSWVIGGNTDDEAFFPVDEFSEHLRTNTAETCNTYNMLKLTRHLFAWSGSAETMDFYERALFNQILGSQDPETGMFVYYCPLRPGGFRTYSSPEDSFWCCVGSGMENHSKYGDTIYFQGDDALYVNLFIPSELTWPDKGLVVRQETEFPAGDTTNLSFRADGPVQLAVKVRYPSWATSGMELAVNGQPVEVRGEPGSYVSVERTWEDGDTVQVRLPMSLRTEAMPDDPDTVAFLYGPIVLAGDLGTEGLEEARRYGLYAPDLRRISPVEVPVLVSTELAPVVASVQPVPGSPLHFRLSEGVQPHPVELSPFYRMYENRYNVYWTHYTPAEWEAHSAEVAAREAWWATVERLTVDVVDLSASETEESHAYDGDSDRDGRFEGRRWREASEGWFSYRMAVDPDRPMRIVATYQGSSGRVHRFDVVVDGTVVATDALEYHPTGLLDHEYAVPPALTAGKQQVTVRFQAHPETVAGRLLEVRTVLAAER